MVLTEFNGEAALGTETQLVWDPVPSTTVVLWMSISTGIATGATQFRVDKTVEGRNGWRLPTVVELTSLVDPSVTAPGPKLPLVDSPPNVCVVDDPPEPDDEITPG